METYELDPLVLVRAMLLTSHDRDDVKTDAIFVHGSPAASDAIDAKLLSLAVEANLRGKSGPVAINGLKDVDCRSNGQRLAYPGSDTWIRVLKGMNYQDYLMSIPPSILRLRAVP